MSFKSILLVGAFALSAVAAPIGACPVPKVEEPVKDINGSAPTLTAEKLIQISPATASCSGADFPEECADAPTIVDALNKAFETYKITSVGEQAAIVAYELFESGNYKYKKNHFPGRPGQGTRMMAMPPFVEKYATALAGADAVATAKAQGGDAGLVAVLDLVNDTEEKSSGSAPWFVSTQCTEAVRAGLAAESVDGWHAFLTECVGTTLAEERDTPWMAAKQILLG
ncbi:hypothetical protein IQ07DRAFT_178956 [Pyrenochaeta sp. DS3sAY3a]|nr:hypothetical protein IQ07DRAFT_178956 [Pyrenochaeta sp. DS3sAY3a]